MINVEAQACGCKRNRLWVRCPLEKMKYIIFSFPRSGDESKCSVKLRHPTRNVFRIRPKVEGGSLNGNVSAMCENGIHCETKKIQLGLILALMQIIFLNAFDNYNLLINLMYVSNFSTLYFLFEYVEYVVDSTSAKF